MGSEEDGISENLLEQADYATKIPMAGKIGSLNVSVDVAHRIRITRAFFETLPSHLTDQQNQIAKAILKEIVPDSAGVIVRTAAEGASEEELRADVERLTKAGDDVCESPYLWETDPAVIEWRAAKEGKPQP